MHFLCQTSSFSCWCDEKIFLRQKTNSSLFDVPNCGPPRVIHYSHLLFRKVGIVRKEKRMGSYEQVEKMHFAVVARNVTSSRMIASPRRPDKTMEHTEPTHSIANGIFPGFVSRTQILIFRIVRLVFCRFFFLVATAPPWSSTENPSPIPI